MITDPSFWQAAAVAGSIGAGLGMLGPQKFAEALARDITAIPRLIADKIISRPTAQGEVTSYDCTRAGCACTACLKWDMSVCECTSWESFCPECVHRSNIIAVREWSRS